jgi:UDP-N-acetylglucosamine diphosphorylase / glucose-1-phosphate thymidylyltransferase / UDP-N-acetylgalactosamine diphosphorylase / glucosamine-1-phosphate N-acetyltransferase / galactosamine-1-phosphate N-acetyltransferase
MSLTNSSLVGIIPAAGSGVRARPYSYEVHKGLFSIDGRSNIARNIDIMRDDFGIRDIVIVTGYMANAVEEAFGNGNDYGVTIEYIQNQHLDRGWAWSILLAKPFIAGRYSCVMLSDEFYHDTNIAELAMSSYRDHLVTVAVKPQSEPDQILKNFSVERSGSRVLRLVENPKAVQNDLLGIATFILSPHLFTLLADVYDSGRPSVEFVSFVDDLIRDGHSVNSFDLTGDYINLNDISSLEAANDLAIRARLLKSSA